MPRSCWDCNGLKTVVILQKKVMIATQQLPQTPNAEAFYDFVKLSKTRQIELLRGYGIFLDQENEKDLVTRLYFLHGFFVEEIFSEQQGQVLELIPYKQGYKLDNYLDDKKQRQ